MPRTVFTKKFGPHTEGRKLQQQINQLEDDIDQLKGLALSLEIGGVQVRILDDVRDVVSVCIPDEDLNKFVAKRLRHEVNVKELQLTFTIEAYEQL